MKHLKRYKVHIDSHHKIIANAFTEKGAKEQAWNSMVYKYGWESKAELMKNVKVERM